MNAKHLQSFNENKKAEAISPRLPMRVNGFEPSRAQCSPDP